MTYKNCTLTNLNDCPINSACTIDENNSSLSGYCACLQNFILNPNYNNSTSFNESDYCLHSEAAAAHTNGTVYYVQPKAQVEHLAFGIIIVLLIAILATALLYFVIVLKPIQRTQRAYVKMKLRRANHEKLQEMDEISIDRRDAQIHIVATEFVQMH